MSVTTLRKIYGTFRFALFALRQGTEMKNLQRIRTRRQLFRITALTAASIPFLALARNSAYAGNNNNNNNNNRPNACLLKGTKISTRSGDRLVQDLKIGDEVQTLSGPNNIKWIGYNKFIKEEGSAWQDS